MVWIQKFVRHLTVHMVIVQGQVGISSTCLVSCWLGVRCGPISRRVREGPQGIGRKLSDSWMFSLTVLQNFSDAYVVALVGILCLIHKSIALGPLILHCPWCVDLVLIPDFSIIHKVLLSHSVCMFLFCFLVVWLECCFHNSGWPPVCSCSLCLITLEIFHWG